MHLSSDLHRNQTSRISGGKESSQSTLSSHKRCNKILTSMIVGENHPRTSYVFVMSDTRTRSVMPSRGGRSVTVSQKKCLDEHSTRCRWSLCNHEDLEVIVRSGSPSARTGIVVGLRAHWSSICTEEILNALNLTLDYPKASVAVDKSFYVDDSLTWSHFCRSIAS